MSGYGPLVSIVVPAFNAGATLAEALRSAQAQTYRAIEIVVVDDGSTDDTAAVAAGFAGVTLLRQANGGIAAARNAGIAAAKGEWIAPLDADDLWHPAKIERQVAAALAAPAPPGFVYCRLRQIDGAGRIVGSGLPHAFQGRVIHQHLYRNFVGAGGALLIRRDALLAAGGYDESLRHCEDILLQFQLASRHPVAVVPEYLLGYRYVPGSMSADRDAMLRYWGAVRRRFRESCPGVAHRYDRWMYARQYYQAATARAKAGRVGGALAALLGALVRDPLYTLGSLGRLLRRRKAPPPPGPLFLEADITTPIGAVPEERPIDMRRLALLARLDGL